MLHFLWCDYNLGENSYHCYEGSSLEIAKWSEYYLGQKTAFHQSSWLAGKVTDCQEDILIGQPTWDSRADIDKSKNGKLLRNWVKDNSLSPSDNCHPNTYIFFPWVPELPSLWLDNMPYLETQLLAARKIFALCGDIWIKRTLEKNDDSIQSRVKDKLIHCNMGVAAQNLPVFKKKFNPIGERQLLHISNLMDYKGFDITWKSLQNIDALLHVASYCITDNIGLLGIDINHEEKYIFNFIGSIDNNDPEFNHWVVENCDFYIHTARMDAQSTTILENCARGLIPLVTPESGFSSPHAIYLTQDPAENHKIVEWALNLPESELLGRSQKLREQMFREHNWEGIFDKIWNEIVIDINHRKLNEST